MVEFDLSAMRRGGLEQLTKTAATRSLSNLEFLIDDSDADDEFRSVLIAGLAEIYEKGSFGGVDCPALQRGIRQAIADHVEEEAAYTVRDALEKEWKK